MHCVIVFCRCSKVLNAANNGSLFFGWDYTINKQEKLHDNWWIERPIFLQNESIRIDSHKSNRIDSNRELECSTRNWDPQCLLLLHFYLFILFYFVLFYFTLNKIIDKQKHIGQAGSTKISLTFKNLVYTSVTVQSCMTCNPTKPHLLKTTWMMLDLISSHSSVKSSIPHY